MTSLHVSFTQKGEDIMGQRPGQGALYIQYNLASIN